MSKVSLSEKLSFFFQYISNFEFHVFCHVSGTKEWILTKLVYAGKVSITLTSVSRSQ